MAPVIHPQYQTLAPSTPVPDCFFGCLLLSVAVSLTSSHKLLSHSARSENGPNTSHPKAAGVGLKFRRPGFLWGRLPPGLSAAAGAAPAREVRPPQAPRDFSFGGRSLRSGGLGSRFFFFLFLSFFSSSLHIYIYIRTVCLFVFPPVLWCLGSVHL